MAHQAQRQFVKAVKDRFPEYFYETAVLEVGSLNINGTVRDFFNGCNYLGCDIAKGNGVDIVSIAHLLEFTDNYFDVIISCECFEHDMFLPHTLRRITNLLRPHGLFLFTCATGDRKEHGTVFHHPEDSPLTVRLPEWQNYYSNVTEDTIRKHISVDKLFYKYEFSSTNRDLMFWGIRSESGYVPV